MALLVVALLVALIVAVLALPVYVRIDLTAGGRVVFKLRIFYLFRLITWEPLQKKQPVKERPAPAGRRRFNWLKALKAMQVDGFWDRLWLLLKRLARATRISRLESDLRVSLGDDYDTGMLIGTAIPLLLIVNGWLSSDLKVVPAFEEDLLLDGYLTGEVSVRPICTIVPVTAFLLSAPVLRFAWVMARAK